MDDETVIIRCECGDRLRCDDRDERVACGCGAEYVVTVTQLSDRGD